MKPCFTEVYRERGEAVGVAEFETMEEMRTAIRRLDESEFKNPFEKSYIRIIEVSSIRQHLQYFECCDISGICHGIPGGDSVVLVQCCYFIRWCYGVALNGAGHDPMTAITQAAR